MKKIFVITISAFILLFASCARSYRVCNPSYVNYTNEKSAGENITVSYAYDVQFENRNYRYSKKEKKANMAMVAIKIQNDTDQDLTITKENFRIETANGNQVPLINPRTYIRRVRQSSELFLLYLLGGITYSAEENEDNELVNEEVGYNPLFLIIGIGNLMYAESANAKQKNHLINKNILNKTVKAKSTLFGLMVIPENNYQELKFEITK